MTNIYDLGFDKSLRKVSEGTASPVVYDANDAVFSGRIPAGIDLDVKSINVAGLTVTVAPGDDIQAAIDTLARSGGGTLQLKTGTYKPQSHLIFPQKTPIQVVGSNMTSCIIDFGSDDRRFVLAGTKIYTTGTVSITAGVVVTGTSTNWLSSGLTTGDQIFLDSRWYEISSVAGNTTIILAEGYGGSALSGATYRAGSIVKDIEFKELTVKNSTSTSGAFDVDDARNILLEDVQVISCNKGIVATNISEWNAERCLVVSSTGDGATFTTGVFITLRQFVAPSNGGHGVVFSGLKTSQALLSSADSNTSDGFNITSCTDVLLEVEANSNGEQGIELVSSNDNILMPNCLVSSNTSDGIKLTATSDNCRISAGKIASNGGLGINIAAGSCDNTVITSCNFASNTIGAVSNNGVGTVKEANTPTSVNDFIITHGSYTPTLTNVANLDSSSLSQAWYHRVGDQVFVAGSVNVDPTADATTTRLGISLPIASAFTGSSSCAGTAFCQTIAGEGAAIFADATNDRAEMRWVCSGTAARDMFFTFSYLIL